jgi:hypothetical protein
MKAPSRTGRRVRRPSDNKKHVAAPTPVPTGNNSHEQPPFLNFLTQTQASLPEIIGETDLATLNSGLRFLFARLREARRQFELERDNGRSGAFEALAAIWMFIVLFEKPRSENLQVPILHLQEALAMLDKNRVLPILKPIPRSGRAGSSYAHATLKGYAAGTVDLLVRTGIKHSEAHRAVAKTLTELGVRPERGSGDVTATTVRNWCNEVSSDVGRRGAAALMYDSMFTEKERGRFSAFSQKNARDFALRKFDAWVRALFPELPKAT